MLELTRIEVIAGAKLADAAPQKIGRGGSIEKRARGGDDDDILTVEQGDERPEPGGGHV